MRTGRHYNKCKWGVLCTRVPIYLYRISPLVPFGLRPYIRVIGHAIVQIGNNNKPKNYDGSNPDNKLLKIPLAREFPTIFRYYNEAILHELCNYRFVSFIETAINLQANMRYSDKENAYVLSINSTIKFSEKNCIEISRNRISFI